ncbi:hypothetical protein BJ508DRAFT_312800 [Ascobolus immersus RN42]|uniref:Uncharacterized protein n=1 Tax=Ascobolus immersus RN42 TaxID=1160509 RepID=A0A3N4HL37_ASCIM|nr:hypothetical protein BJ508DRAFT_312800 [Ascobolus immersus RN42]
MAFPQPRSQHYRPCATILSLPNEILHDIVIRSTGLEDFLSTSLEDFIALSLVNPRFQGIVFEALRLTQGQSAENWIALQLDRKSDKAHVVELLFNFLRDACTELIRLEQDPGYANEYEKLTEAGNSKTAFEAGAWEATRLQYQCSRQQENSLSALFKLKTSRLGLFVRRYQWKFKGGQVGHSLLCFNTQRGPIDIKAWPLRDYYRLRSRLWNMARLHRESYGLVDMLLISALLKGWNVREFIFTGSKPSNNGQGLYSYRKPDGTDMEVKHPDGVDLQVIFTDCVGVHPFGNGMLGLGNSYFVKKIQVLDSSVQDGSA